LGDSKLYDLYFNYSPYITDVSGNRFQNSRRYRFTTGADSDNVAPSLLSSSIPDGQSDVPVNARVVLTFDERISPSCVDKVSLRSGLETIQTTNTLSNNNTITLVPDSQLTPAGSYSVVAFGLCDYAGNSLNQSLLTFTSSVSADADLARPNLNSSSPGSNETGIALDTSIMFTFDESISATSSVILYNGSTVVQGAQQVNGSQLIFTPSEPLLPGIRYRIFVGNIYDFANNATNFGNRYFTTEN
jgi:methionine-rich copper-binding protein CopC